MFRWPLTIKYHWRLHCVETINRASIHKFVTTDTMLKFSSLLHPWYSWMDLVRYVCVENLHYNFNSSCFNVTWCTSIDWTHSHGCYGFKPLNLYQLDGNVIEEHDGAFVVYNRWNYSAHSDSPYQPRQILRQTCVVCRSMLRVHSHWSCIEGNPYRDYL